MLVTGSSTGSAETDQPAVAAPFQIESGLSPDLDIIMDHIHSVSLYQRKIGIQA